MADTLYAACCVYNWLNSASQLHSQTICNLQPGKVYLHHELYLKSMQADGHISFFILACTTSTTVVTGIIHLVYQLKIEHALAKFTVFRLQNQQQFCFVQTLQAIISKLATYSPFLYVHQEQRRVGVIINYANEPMQSVFT